jgi:hypothetical protein
MGVIPFSPKLIPISPKKNPFVQEYSIFFNMCSSTIIV